MVRFQLIILLCLCFAFPSCDMTNRFSQYMSDRINKRELKKFQDMKQEMRSYLIHAQKCKTEYEIESFKDSLPYLRASEIERWGGEANWKAQLEWLKDNGATKVSFIKTFGGGNDDLPIPFMYRTPRSLLKP